MLYVDIPSLNDFTKLSAQRNNASVSLYLPTTPVTQDVEASRIAFGNLVKAAFDQLTAAGTDKRQLAALGAHLDDLADDDDFWARQAHSLAVLATPEGLQTFRLPNRLTEIVEVSDRFHLKPLLRSLTFADSALVLAISENEVRLVEVSADLPPKRVKVADLPKDAASAVGVSTINDRSPKRRITGSEGQKVRLTQYARAVDHAIRPIVRSSGLPLILAATEPLASLYRSVSSAPLLLPDVISSTNDRSSEAELADAARPVLDATYAREVEAFRELFAARESSGRSTTDISDAARAATFGAIDSLMVDIDEVVHGSIDEESGAVTFEEPPNAKSYGIVDEIAARALASGARVLGVRKQDMPGEKGIAAILRYAV
jgi:hypothetical protein